MQICHANIVYSKDRDELAVFRDSYIAMEKGTVEGIYPTLPEKNAGAPLTDFGSSVLIPAFSDLHVHAPQFPQRGLGMDLLLAATLLSPLMGNGNQATIYIAILCAALGGALFSCLHGLLCIRFRANQVISGVVINILSVALTAFFTSATNSAINGNVSNKFVLDVSTRFTVPLLSEIPWIGGLFTDMYPFEIIIAVLVVIMWYLMNRTRFGMRLRACGENPQAVDAAGASVTRIRWTAVMISGALSGIGGICFAYSLMGNFSPSIYQGFGYLAIAAKLSSNYTDLFMLMPYVLTLLLLVFFSKKNRPPKAAGEPWDKSKR